MSARVLAGACLLALAAVAPALRGGATSLSVVHALAAPSAPVLRIEAPAPLAVGNTASIAVLVRLPEGPPQPLLLTPRIEGEAVRVVRGRLLRADAQLEPSGELRFAVPVIARRAGTAVLHVELLTYRCEGSTCSAVHAAASSPLLVGGS